MPTGLTVLIDDVRWFRDARPCEIARTSSAGLALLLSLRDRRIDDLWLVNPAGAVIMRQRLSAVGYEVSHHYDVRVFQNRRPKELSDHGVTVGRRGGRP